MAKAGHEAIRLVGWRQLSVGAARRRQTCTPMNPTASTSASHPNSDAWATMSRMSGEAMNQGEASTARPIRAHKRPLISKSLLALLSALRLAGMLGLRVGGVGSGMVWGC